MMRKHPLLAFVLVTSTSTLACSGGSGSSGSSGTSRDTPADVTFGNPAVSVCSNGSTDGGGLTADFNGDGLPDLLGCQDVDPQSLALTSAMVFLNLGGGAFDAGHVVSLPGDGYGLDALDIDGDGKADLVNIPDEANPTILFSNGDGTFGRSIQQSNFPASCGVDQYSLDGYADAICQSGTTLTVLHMASDGSTLPGFTVTVPSWPSIVDINGDGELDFVFRLGSTLAVELGDGGSSFSALDVIITSDSPVSVPDFADIDGDGLIDLFVRGAAPTTPAGPRASSTRTKAQPHLHHLEPVRRGERRRLRTSRTSPATALQTSSSPKTPKTSSWSATATAPSQPTPSRSRVPGPAPSPSST